MKNKTFKKLVRLSLWTVSSVIVVCLLISTTVYLMRDKIVDKVVTELNKNLATPIDVSSIDLTFWASFPNLSVDFNDLYIRDAIPEAASTDTFFFSERVRLKFNPFDLINKEYKVKKIEVFPGYAHIKNFADGRNNYSITKPSDDSLSASSFDFTLNEVAFTNFRFDYSNFEAKQYHSTRLDEMVLSGDFTEKIIDLNAESNLHINYAKSGEVKLVQNQTAYFDLNLRINQEDGSVVLKEAPVEIADLPFTFGLVIQPNLIDVQLKAKNLQLVDVAKSIQHQSTKTVNDLKGSGTVQFELHYKDKREKNKVGEIACHFDVRNGNIVEPTKNLRISGINIRGYYGNSHKEKGEHLDLSELQFETIAGPFAGHLLLTHFDQPRYRGNAKGQIDLAVLHAIFPLPLVQSTSGQVKIDSRFDVKTANGEIDIQGCSGNVYLTNVQCQLQEDKRYFDHISGKIFLNTDQIALDKLSLTVGRSDLALNGKIEQLQSYLNRKGKLSTQLAIRSAFLDVQDFATNERAEVIQNERNFVLPNDISGHVHLLANNLQYEKHQFKYLSTNLKIDGRSLSFGELKLQNAGADVVGRVLIQENQPEIFTISTNASSNNISFQPLFQEWDNFQQDVISSENISGIAQANLIFKAPFDLRSGIDMNSILATVKLKIDDGKLRNVETFKSITASLQESTATKLILKENNINTFEKNLLNLQFQSLENTLTIQNGVLTIPKMTIASNALTVNLSGTHTFNNQVDYHFDFNLRDIKKIKTETEFGEVVDDGTGLRLFAHMYGDIDSPTIKWDKEQKRMLAKENLQQEKMTTKEMLKAEFGLFKKDTAVVAYKAKVKPKEEIHMQFQKTNAEDITPEIQKKETKLGKTFQKWKEDATRSKAGELVIKSD